MLSLTLNQCFSFTQSEEVTIVPRAQEKTYRKVKSNSDLGIFVDVARGLGRVVKKFRSTIFNFLTQVKEPFDEVEDTISGGRKKFKKERLESSEVPSNSSRKIRTNLQSYTEKNMTRVELVKDLVSVFREVSGIFVEFFRTISDPVREFKSGVRRKVVRLDYSEEYYEPQRFRSRSKRHRTTVRTILLEPIVEVNLNRTRRLRKKIVMRKRRRISEKKLKRKSEQTQAMEELLTHI
uniref:Uncharacterized protein n=1 Tax=Clastoptera arizonana TaxID=38151 RepID=A0A1B6DBR3_9HEMI